MNVRTIACCAAVCFLALVSVGQTAEWGMKEGNPEIKSAGPLAFGPDGILFIGDTKAATIFAVATGDASSATGKHKIQIDGLKSKIAETLKTTPEEVTVNDLATNPESGNVFLSVMKGKGDTASPAIVRINEAGKLNEVSLKKIPFQKVALPDPPEDKEIVRGSRKMNPRDSSITDLAYIDGKVLVSGLATGQAASVHQLPFPFADGLTGTNIEIFHGAHGRSEDNANIRTFVPMSINGEPSLLAGFQCTPLVRFPISNLKPSEKTRGTTVAELGNQNLPLDMIAYQKDGKNYLLLSNSARGVMKISTENIGRSDGITERVKDKAGQSYETIKELEGVVQLDRLNDDDIVIIVQASKDAPDVNLKTVPLP